MLLDVYRVLLIPWSIPWDIWVFVYLSVPVAQTHRTADVEELTHLLEGHRADKWVNLTGGIMTRQELTSCWYLYNTSQTRQTIAKRVKASRNVLHDVFAVVVVVSQHRYCGCPSKRTWFLLRNVSKRVCVGNGYRGISGGRGLECRR